ncbi:MAG TPA: hypothetical protein VK212_01595 [Lentimicrobium sp.]|nr:hypothetical protein [Lentimicrobium sp.]
MKAFKYGIVLERLKERDIELVREWRNSDRVRLNMEYRKIISPEEQLIWFRSINNLSNNYMVIHYQGEKIGLLNDKNIDWKKRTSESGLFIGVEKYCNSFVPYFVSVAGIELNFHFLNWQKQYAHILRSNPNAIKYNQELGYILCRGQKDIENQLYEMTRASFEQSAGKIRNAVHKIAVEGHLPKLLLEPEDYESGFAGLIEPLLVNRPEIISYKSDEGMWFEEQEQ